MKRIMAVVSVEKLFAERFCNFINHNSHIVFTAVPFSDMEALHAYRKKVEVPVVLCDSAFLPDAAPEPGVRTIPLCENEEERDKKRAVYKYQSAEAITREIMELLGDMHFSGGFVFEGRPAAVIGVYSPGASARKTSFALALSEELGKKHKVLYLDFEEFPGLLDITGENYERGLSNLLYYLRQGSLRGENILSVVYSLAGFEYVPPIRFAEDMSSVTGEECARLISTIFAETLYDVVVADLPVSLSQSSELMDLCKSVYLVYDPGIEGAGRVRDFENYLSLSGRDKLSGKIKRIALPREDVMPIPGMTGTEYIRRLFYGPFGRIIREEAEKEDDEF